jgi:NAD(P) transhydrogenase subunit alpha
VVRHGVVISGLTNLLSTVPYHASQMYARTVTSFLMHLVKQGSIQLDLSDELTRGPLVTHQGEILHEAVKATLADVDRMESLTLEDFVVDLRGVELPEGPLERG